MKLLYKQRPNSASRQVDEIVEFATEVLQNTDWTPEDIVKAFKLILDLVCMCSDWERLVWAINNATDLRRLCFITEHGSIGMGPPAIQPGDVVAILFGAKAPFILRPTDIDGEYRLIGQCYVNGIMHGEHIEKLKAKGRFEESTTTFTLV
jgi:hypothetical protein